MKRIRLKFSRSVRAKRIFTFYACQNGISYYKLLTYLAFPLQFAFFIRCMIFGMKSKSSGLNVFDTERINGKIYSACTHTILFEHRQTHFDCTKLAGKQQLAVCVKCTFCLIKGIGYKWNQAHLLSKIGAHHIHQLAQLNWSIGKRGNEFNFKQYLTLHGTFQAGISKKLYIHVIISPRRVVCSMYFKCLMWEINFVSKMLNLKWNQWNILKYLNEDRTKIPPNEINSRYFHSYFNFTVHTPNSK